MTQPEITATKAHTTEETKNALGFDAANDGELWIAKWYLELILKDLPK